MKAFIQAMLAKQAWRLTQSPHSLVASLLKARYFSHSTFLNAGKGHHPSLVCTRISWGKELLMSGIRKKVGDSTSISIYTDTWISRCGKLAYLSNPSYQKCFVSSLIASNGAWDVIKLYTLFPNNIC
uniref:Uncharacterized protein n=1 Tax=Cannabis sativa TaxID=3483 RepID=A0A803QSY5_CANSA